MVLSAEGYRAEKALQHYRTIHAMSLILGDDRRSDAAYLETCRQTRNIIEYERAGSVTEDDAKELVDFVRSFRNEVSSWLGIHYPELLTGGPRIE